MNTLRTLAFVVVGLALLCGLTVGLSVLLFLSGPEEVA